MSNHTNPNPTLDTLECGVIRRIIENLSPIDDLLFEHLEDAYDGAFETIEDWARNKYGWENKELDEEEQAQLDSDLEYLKNPVLGGPAIEYYYDEATDLYYFFTFV